LIACEVSKAPPCDSDANCPLNATCSSEKLCVCDDKYVISGDWTKCLQVQPHPYSSADKCEENSQCSGWMGVGAICSENMCVCKDNYHYLHGFCTKSIGLDEKCTEDDDCYEGYSYEAVKCDSKKKVCVCAEGFYRINDAYNVCRKQGISVGDECMFDMDCAGGLYCNQTAYRCANSSKDVFNTTKVPWTPIEYEYKEGDICQTSCYPRGKLECFLDKCTCRNGFSNYKDYCTRDLGETCSNHSECAHIGNAECSGVCRCKLPYVKTKDNRNCKLARPYGAQCQSDEACMTLGGGAYCKADGIYKNCNCKQGYHYVDSLKLCIPDKVPQESCYQDFDCVADSSSCVNGNCTCHDGYHENSALCVADVNVLGDYCLNVKDCSISNNTVCKNSKCTCVNNYFATEDQVTCLKGVAAACSNVTQDCAADGSSCIQGKCACPDNYVGSSDFSKCLPVVVKGRKCEEDSQCRDKLGIEGGACVDGVCGCKEGYHFNNNYCWKSTKLGETCQYESQCYLKSGLLDRVKCRNGICACEFQYEQAEDLECRSGVGKEGASAAVTGLFLLIAVLNMRDGWTAGRP
ncbi:hypothetical protein L9F63_003220, partial [Diploptera punctata]